RITADGPSVIGWDRIIDRAQQMFGLSLAAARERGELGDVPVAPVARMLAAALKDAGLMIATADDPAAARAEASTATRGLISGLLAPTPSAPARSTRS